MPSNTTPYRIELLCDYSDWWRYNIYIMSVGFNRNNDRVAFNELIDRVYELDYDDSSRNAPKDYKEARKLCLTTDPADYIDVYLYAVTNTFPQSTQIKDSPPFTVTLRVTANDKVVDETHFEVNQWGGLTVVAHRVDRLSEQE